jgi:tRNA G18 (ribose-2'-O)-methylase SpoU
VPLGHEHHGVPEDVRSLLDGVVEIPMVGRGASLDAAVAGSLLRYRFACHSRCLTARDCTGQWSNAGNRG